MLSSTRKILIIDDDIIAGEHISMVLRQLAYQPFVASSGADGIEAALRAPPDLVLCDLWMPGIDGFAVLARLRAEPRTASIPILLVTSSHDPLDARVGRSLGANGYLNKPVDVAMLGRLIELNLGGLREAGVVSGG